MITEEVKAARGQVYFLSIYYLALAEALMGRERQEHQCMSSRGHKRRQGGLAKFSALPIGARTARSAAEHKL